MTSAIDRLAPAVARVLDADGKVVGAGFLIAPDTVCTCAHVVARARGPERAAAEGGTVTVDFPLLRDTPHARRTYQVHVSAWEPVADDGSGDIALLRLPEELPQVVRPVPLVSGSEMWGHRFRVLGFPAGSDHGQWAQGRVRDRVGAGWVALSEEYDRLRRITRGFSGSPVWDEELGGVIGMVVATARGASEDTAYLVPSAALVELQPGLRRCPYRGLEPFREEDAEFFYGREADVRRVTDAVLRHPVVTVVGASGSGKSSLVRAGLLPELRARGYSVTAFRPIRGARPVRALARALEVEPAAADSDLTETAALLTEDLLARSGEHGHVLFLDQFEEVAATEPDEARRLLALAVAMTRAARPTSDRALRVVATLRHGSLDGLVEPGMAGLLSEGTQIIAPLDRAALLRAITGSAGRVPGLAFEPGLPERIVDDAEAEPGCLPLVQFALTRLWENRQHTLLTHAAYESLGRVGGALTAYAERSVAPAMADLGEDTLRRLLAQLARPDEKAEFVRMAARLDGLDPQLRHAAHALSQTRLVILNHTAEGEEIVDLAHESLIRQWPRAHAWLEETREFRAWQEQVRAATAVWRQNNRDAGALMRGAVLERALEWRTRRAPDIGKEELAYIEQSDRRRRRGVRRLRVTAACIALLGVVAGVLAVFSYQQASRQRVANDRIASQLLAAEADTRLGAVPSQSLALALEAWRRSPTAQARAALLNQYLSLTGTTVVADGIVGSGSTDFAASADGRVIALMAPRGERRVVSVVTVPDSGAARVTRLGGVPGEADSVDVSDDGARVAVAAGDGAFAVWEPTGRGWDRTAAGRWAPEHRAANLSTLRLDFAPDGRRLLHLVTGDETKSCATASGWRSVWTTQGRPRRIGGVTGRPEGSRCVTDAALVTNDGDVALVREGPRPSRASVGVEARSPGAPDWSLPDVAEARFAPSGRGIVVEDENRDLTALYLLDGSGRLSRIDPAALPGRVGPYGWNVDLSGRYLLGSDFEGSTLVRDLRTHKVYSVHFSSSQYSVNGDAPASVVPRRGASPWLFWGVGTDLVRSASEVVTVESGPGPEGYDSEPLLLTDDHALYARAETYDSAESVLTVVPRRTGGENTRLTTPNHLKWIGSGPLTTDDAYFGFWDEDGLGYFRPADPAARVLTLPRRGPKRPVLGAAPLSESEAAVLTEDGLGRFSLSDRPAPSEPVPGAPCTAAVQNAPVRDTCLAVVARPGHPGQVALLFGDGRIELWRLSNGAAGRMGTIETGVDASEDAVRYEQTQMAFLGDGDGLLVSSSGWTSLWRFGRTEPLWSVSAPEIDLRAVFLSGGDFYESIVSSDVFRTVRVSDDDSTEIASGVVPGPIAFHGHTMEYMTGYRILRVPLRGPDLARSLCAALDGEYDAGDLNSILRGLGVDDAGRFCP
ncbi:trypsin-like peptidase domain-containing protein [Streptomyces sp. NPDC059010]|uniref:nSTAND1 domain-containing NTPase n=1 Tax=Streptomyces sp. NPDC059010 TaxID=3346695 RepID=UPI00367A9785